MTPEELAAAVASEKSDYERETLDLESKLRRAQAKVERLESKLALIRSQYQRRISLMAGEVLGLPKEDLDEPRPNVKRDHPPGARAPRGSFDGPILELARELAAPDVTAQQIREGWNLRQPDQPVQDSTVRGVLERLVRKNLLQISTEGGGRGSGIPKKYRPPKAG